MMTKPLIGILLLLPLSALAQTQVPNVFEDGTPASAAEVNENFDALEAALPPSNCSTDQIIKWDGLAWVCATDPVAGVDCDVGGPMDGVGRVVARRAWLVYHERGLV